MEGRVLCLPQLAGFAGIHEASNQTVLRTRSKNRLHRPIQESIQFQNGSEVLLNRFMMFNGVILLQALVS